MARAKEKPLYSNPTDYEDDFYLWLYEQAELLRLGRFDELDRPNLIEEIESVAREIRLRSERNYRLLLFNLLRWEHQPQLRKRLWLVEIGRMRQEIATEEEYSQSLKSDAKDLMKEAYEGAKEEAAIWIDVKPSDFPPLCPYTLQQIRDHDWLPGPALPGVSSLPPLRDLEDD